MTCRLPSQPEGALKGLLSVAHTESNCRLPAPIGPQPHPGFVEFFGEAAVDDRQGTVERERYETDLEIATPATTLFNGRSGLTITPTQPPSRDSKLL
jgi:hypothetical protein